MAKKEASKPVVLTEAEALLLIPGGAELLAHLHGIIKRDMDEAGAGRANVKTLASHLAPEPGVRGSAAAALTVPTEGSRPRFRGSRNERTIVSTDADGKASLMRLSPEVFRSVTSEATGKPVRTETVQIQRTAEPCGHCDAGKFWDGPRDKHGVLLKSKKRRATCAWCEGTGRVVTNAKTAVVGASATMGRTTDDFRVSADYATWFGRTYKQGADTRAPFDLARLGASPGSDAAIQAREPTFRWWDNHAGLKAWAAEVITDRPYVVKHGDRIIGFFARREHAARTVERMGAKATLWHVALKSRKVDYMDQRVSPAGRPEHGTKVLSHWIVVGMTEQRIAS
jgi:hypothetical protein